MSAGYKKGSRGNKAKKKKDRTKAMAEKSRIRKIMKLQKNGIDYDTSVYLTRDDLIFRKTMED